MSVLTPEVVRHPSGIGGWLRVTVSAVIALVVTVGAPLGLYFATGVGPGSYEGPGEILFLYLPLLLGSFVFTTMEKPRPEWWHGVAFASAVAVVSTIVVFTMASSFERPGGAELVFGALMFVVMGAMLGMAGSGVAVLVSRPLVAEDPGFGPARIKPWHLGAAVAVIELVTVGALVAALG